MPKSKQIRVISRKSFPSKILAISLPALLASQVQASETWEADIATNNNLQAKYSFSACYGPLDKPQGPECEVNFVDGTMNVNGSGGVTPDQIKTIENGWYSNGYYVSMQYTTSEGSTSLAQFTFYEKHVAKQFLDTVVAFKSNMIEIKEEKEAEQRIDEYIPQTEIDVKDTSECTPPYILCFDTELQNTDMIKTDKTESVTTEIVESEEIVETETSESTTVIETEPEGCTSPTILCF